jgi:6-pyruvoyltetrahydropterin/6-carboxytetrahydropterin synthase
MELRKTFRFEASHVLPKHPGKCSRLHGHSWVLHMSVEGEINPDTGFVMDFADISKIVKPLIEKLDHRHLGTYGFFTDDKQYQLKWGVSELAGIYPTSENLLCWIGLQLRDLPWSKLAIEETCTSMAILTRKEYDGNAT